MRKVVLVIVFLLTMLSAIAKTAENGLLWNNVDVRGRQMAVFSLFTDSRGLVWVGTNNGLFGYDGFSTFPADPTGANNAQIYSIIEYDGKLYAGTNNGIFTYDLSTGTISFPEGDFPMEIRSLLLNGDELLIGSLYNVFLYNLKDGSLRDISQGLPHKSVYALLRDRRGVIYAGTYDGLARWNVAKGVFEPVDVKCAAKNGGNLFVNAIAEDTDGSLWLGTEGALIHFNPVSDKAENDSRFDGLTIKSLAPADDGKLLVGTDAGLIIRDGDATYRYRHDSSDRQSIADNEIWSLMTDRKGNVWAGTETGVSMASDSEVARSRRLDMIVDNREGNRMHTIYRDSRGDLWAGGQNGLLRMGADGNAERYAPGSPKPLSHKRVRDIMEDSSGKLWVATDGGVNLYDRAADRFIPYHITDSTGHYNANWVYSIVEDGDSLLTGSYLGGIHIIAKNKLRPGGGTVVADRIITANDGLANDFVSKVIKDSKGNKWVLLFRDNALIRIDSRTGAIKRIDIKEISGEYPTLVTTDSRGRLWCGYYCGATVLDSDGNVLGECRIPMNDSDDYVMAMEPVGDDMWFSTVYDVWKANGNDFTVDPLALPSKLYTSIYDDRRNGNVVLGAVDEIVTVDLANLRKLSRGGNIRLIRSGGNETFTETGKEGYFEVDSDGSIELTVSTLDYAPEMQHFAYKIMKNESDTVGDWTPLPEGSNVLRFSNMSIGTHHIGVRLALPGSPVCRFNLRVLPPWYLSAWAIALYVILVGAAIIMLVLWLRRRASRRIADADRERAIAAAEQRLTFLSDISHDLKTPLSLIIAPVSRLREKVKDPAEKRSLDMVYDNALKLNNLIHRTIEIKTLDSDDDTLLIMSRFDAVEFCRSIFESYRENHADKNFILHAPDRPVIIEADAVKLESIVNNLLSNACKYSDDNATISLSVSEKNGRLELIVSDDGMGIPAAEQSLVFERMYRSSRTAGLREGTGIGLYLIKKYLELHHGTISLYSRENEGTTFIITLPLAPSDAQGESAVAAQADPSLPKVLIVEDNASIAELISETLSEKYNCAIAGNGRSGLAMASSFNPDLVIADQMMPAMSGLDMVRRMKENPRLSTVPVIMLTAKTDNATETESVRLGIDAFMPKPFEPQTLVARVGQLLATREKMRQAVRIEELSTPKPIEIESVSEKQLMKVSKIIEDNMSDPDLNVSALAEQSGISTKNLYRLVKKYIGDSPVDYIRRMRLRKAAMLLEQQKFTVSEIMYMVGFKTSSYFSKCFQAEYGCTPSEYAKRSSEKAE